MPNKKKPKKKAQVRSRENRTEDRPQRIQHIEIENGRVNGKPLFVRLAINDDGTGRVSLGSSFSKLQMAITTEAVEQLAALVLEQPVG